jgi:hypothetical protein
MGLGKGMDGMVAVAESRDGEGVSRRGQARARLRRQRRVWHLVSRRRQRRRKTHANTKQLRRLLHGIGLLGSENEGGAAPEKTVTSLGRKGVLDLAKVNARLG